MFRIVFIFHRSSVACISKLYGVSIFPRSVDYAAVKPKRNKSAEEGEILISLYISTAAQFNSNLNLLVSITNILDTRLD